jgi:hypothetical protein
LDFGFAMPEGYDRMFARQDTGATIHTRSTYTQGVTFVVSAAGAQAWRRLRLALLTVASVAIVHEIEFRVRFGIGTAYDDAMARSGHGTWWTMFLVASLAVVVGLAATALVHHRRLSTALNLSGGTALDVAPVAARRHEWLGLWAQLGAWVVALFLAQENIEHLVTEGHLAGIDPLAGSGGAVVWLVVALVTVLAAAAGAIVLWTEARLLERIALARTRHRRRLAIRAHPRWSTTATLRLRSELLSRHLLGRAPPNRSIA